MECLMLILLLLVNITAGQPVNATLDALEEIYADLGVAQQNGSDPCVMLGVGCDSLGNVILFDLTGKNLPGSISPHIANLTYLQSLKLGQNQLNGALPSEIVSLPLVTLDVNSNLLTGVLPSISDESPWTTSMVYIDASSNQFSGSLPQSWGQMKSLNNLNLGTNKISGGLPEEWSGMKSIAQIQLTNNLLFSSLPSSWARWEDIETIILDNNLLSGDLPESWGNMTTLKILNVRDNLLTGSIPESYSNMISIEQFRLSSNQISGNLPPLLTTNWTKIATFSLYSNSLFGTLPRQILRPSMVTIDFGNNQFYGEFPKNFTFMTSLVTVYLDHNQFSGTLDGVFPLFGPDLAVFFAEDCHFSGLMPYINDHINLEMISFRNSDLSGPLPEVSNLTQLYWLELQGNNFVGVMTYDIFNLPSSYLLDVSDNNLVGPLPKKVAPSLRYLGMSLNKFNEPFPECFTPPNYDYDNGAIMNMVFIGCNFSGILPDVFQYQSIAQVYLGGNNFTGPLPPSLFQSSTMILIALGPNNFTGMLPDTKKLVNIKFLETKACNLEGPLPDLSNSLALEYVDLSLNRYSGPVPTFRSKPLKELYLNDNRFSGEICYNNSLNSFLPESQYGENLKISLSNNRLTGLFCLMQIPSIAFIDMSRNMFSALYIPKTVQFLTTLYANDNLLTGGAILSALSLRTKLQVLDLSQNQITGVIPSALDSWRHTMTYFAMDNNRLTFGLSRLNYLNVVQYVSLANNLIYDNGDFSWIFEMKQLKTFRVSNNSLNMHLSDSFDQLLYLQTVDLSGNSLYGGIPSSLCQQSQLTSLSLHHNNLEGPICHFKSDIVNLTLNGNRFTGDTSFLTTLGSLSSVDLSSNDLSGQLVLDINTRLVNLNISNNKLSGQPPMLSSLDKLAVVDMSHNRFSGIAPSLINSPSVISYSAGYNYFTELTSFTKLQKGAFCDLTNNLFVCGLAREAADRCQATCKIDNFLAVNASIQISPVQNFDASVLFRSLSDVLNISLSRLQMISMNSKRADTTTSVAVTFQSPSPSSQEASSQRALLLLSTIYNETSLPYTIQKVTYPYTVPDSSQIVVESTRTSVIVGSAFGGVASVIILVGLFIFYIVMKRQRRRLLLRNEFKTVDLSTVNFGDTKRAIIDLDDVSGMNVIGQGSFGVVMKGVWRSQPVAVKQVKPNGRMEPAQQLADFLTEVNIIQNLKPHPNVVLFMGITFPPQILSLVTEFCDGGNLHRYLRQNNVSLDRKMKFIQGIARGMFHLHQEGIIHRDLAARNILLTKHLGVKVSDFGLSREAGDDIEDSPSTTVSTIGPFKHMAPEALKNRQYSRKSDVYSFSTTVWEILTCRDPYINMTVAEVILQVTNKQRLPIPEDTDANLHDLMTRCWAEFPEDRPTFKEIMEYLDVITGVSRRQRTPESQTTVAAPAEIIISVYEHQSGHEQAGEESELELKEIEKTYQGTMYTFVGDSESGTPADGSSVVGKYEHESAV